MDKANDMTMGPAYPARGEPLPLPWLKPAPFRLDPAHSLVPPPLPAPSPRGGLVYLAGPIAGLEHDAATDWRDTAALLFAPRGIHALSPLRGKGELKMLGPIPAAGKAYDSLGALSQPAAIMARDRNDATRCDVLLVNLLGAKRVSIGTVMEIAWADLKRIPIVLVIETEGNVHEHIMIQQATSVRVDNLSEAVDVVSSIIG